MALPSDASENERSLVRRERRERLSFAVSGSMFLFAAVDGALGPSPAPSWSVAALLALGVVQGAAFVLALRRGTALPEALANLLAAAGMAVSAVLLRHHHFLIPLFYSVAGVVKLFRAWKGTKAPSPWSLARRAEADPLTSDAAPLPVEGP